MIEAIICIIIGCILGFILILLQHRSNKTVNDGLEHLKESTRRLEDLQQATGGTLGDLADLQQTTNRVIGQLEDLQLDNENGIESIEKIIQRIETDNFNSKN